MEHAFTGVAQQIPTWDESQGTRKVVMVNAPDFATLLRIPAIYDFHHGQALAASWHELSAAPHDQRLWRSGPLTLEMEVIDGQMLASFGEQVVRYNHEPLKPGDVIDDGLFRAEILASNELGPTRVAFHFDHDLDAPDMVFLAWGDGKLEPIELPEEGGHISLKSYPGPMLLAFMKSE
jgi:hypothetical protein